MNRIIKQGILGGFLLGLFGLAVYLNRGTAVEAGISREEAIRRYGFYLDESAARHGIDSRHESPTLDPKFAHIMPLVAGMGAGAAVVDFDRDGWLDIYAVTGKEGGANRLYRNRGDGTFEDVAGPLGVADVNRPGTGVSMGSAWADYDNDGFPDLCVYKWGKPELFRNLGGKRFERVTGTAGLPGWSNANAACWLDYDRDGLIDLFIAGYWRDDIDLWNLATTRVMPESFEYAKNGGRKYLLRNRGDGTFEDVTAAAGIASTRWTLGVVAADLTGDGYPDIVLANDYGVSEFYANKGDGTFAEVGHQTGIGVAPKSGMNASLGDALNLGQFAIYISNISEAGNLVQGNNLWVPTKEKTKDGWPKYLNQADPLNVSRGGWSWGAKFGDLNNDGRLDLYLTNGYVSADPGRSYWYDYGKIAGGLGGLIENAALWPAMRGQSLAGYQPKCVWMNKGDRFLDVCQAVGVTDTYDGRAVALGDLFNRGVIDVTVTNQGGPLLLYENTVAPGRDWVQFQLTGGARPGREAGWSNRDAVGAEVKLTWRQGNGPSITQVQVVTAGDGYASQSMLRLHFGLGTGATIEQAVIRWPSGHTQTVPAPKTNVRHSIEESR